MTAGGREVCQCQVCDGTGKLSAAGREYCQRRDGKVVSGLMGKLSSQDGKSGSGELEIRRESRLSAAGKSCQRSGGGRESGHGQRLVEKLSTTRRKL